VVWCGKLFRAELYKSEKDLEGPSWDKENVSNNFIFKQDASKEHEYESRNEDWHKDQVQVLFVVFLNALK